MGARFIQCNNCGGTRGTLVKAGDHYCHQRSSDCEEHRVIMARIARRAEVLKQARPKPKIAVARDKRSEAQGLTVVKTKEREKRIILQRKENAI